MHKTKRDSKELFARDTHPELPLDPDAVQPGKYKWPLHFTPSLLLIVFAGGSFGALARYWVSLQLSDGTSGWPAATFLVNLLGAFLLGLLLEGLVRLGPDTGARRVARLGVGTGFMGAFTTYSTLAVETNLLLAHDHLALAAWYAFASVAGGITCSIIGIQLAAVHHKQREST
jgi:CrcB protein